MCFVCSSNFTQNIRKTLSLTLNVKTFVAQTCAPYRLLYVLSQYTLRKEENPKIRTKANLHDTNHCRIINIRNLPAHTQTPALHARESHAEQTYSSKFNIKGEGHQTETNMENKTNYI